MYVSGLIIPVPEENLEAYRAWAESGAQVLQGVWMPGDRRVLGGFRSRRERDRLSPRRRREGGREDRLHLAGLARQGELLCRRRTDAPRPAHGCVRRAAVRCVASHPRLLPADLIDGKGLIFAKLDGLAWSAAHSGVEGSQGGEMAVDYDVVETSIATLAADMAAGEVTAEALVAAYRARIEQIDWSGPTLRSVICLSPTADEDARALDAERRAGRVRGPLHGVPLLIKDNIETDDGTPTTAGSLALIDNVTLRDAPVVRRLKDAGAVMLGKTNLSEWANFRSAHSISGWSAIGGLVKNPYALDRSASGSSSGTGAAIAASLAAAGGRHRDRRLGDGAVLVRRPCRTEADGGAGVAQPGDPDLAQPGHARSDGAQRRGRRDPADRHGRVGPRRPSDGRGRRTPHRLRRRAGRRDAGRQAPGIAAARGPGCGRRPSRRWTRRSPGCGNGERR